jgi:hypothetical protein
MGGALLGTLTLHFTTLLVQALPRLIACAFLKPISLGGWARTVGCVTIIFLLHTNENDLLFYLLLMR